MGQINTTNLPQYVSDTRPAVATTRSGAETTNASLLQESSTPQDALQFTKLSSALSSLKKSSSVMRSQATQVMSSVRSGTYQIDPMQVSRSIVGESLAAH